MLSFWISFDNGAWYLKMFRNKEWVATGKFDSIEDVVIFMTMHKNKPIKE